MAEFEVLKPEEIEARSMAIIAGELSDRRRARALAGGGPVAPRTPLEEAVLKRVIHTTADFDFDESLFFTHDAAEAGARILKDAPQLVTDTQMALAGINKRVLAANGGSAACFIADEDVAAEAKKRGTTRAAVAVEKAAAVCGGNLVFAIGNAPTALIRISELIREGRLAPRLIIGVPVGFVNVSASKELLFDLDIPCIIARGNKGGSNIAAAIVNALQYA